MSDAAMRLDPRDIALIGRAIADAAPPEGALYDAKTGGKLLNVPASWLLAEARADRIPHIRLGRYVRFDAHQLRDWVAARSRGPRSGRTASQGVSDRREGRGI